jgi:thiamine-monophosphate kinase
MAEVSGVEIRIEVARVPLSVSARDAITGDARLLEVALTGGDDYELLFSAPRGAEEKIAEVSEQTGIPVARLGEIRAGAGVHIEDAEGRPLTLKKAGFTHF